MVTLPKSGAYLRAIRESARKAQESQHVRVSAR